MIKTFILFLLIIFGTESFSQNSLTKKAFSNFSFGVYGGVSTLDFELYDGSLLFEAKSNLTENLFLNFSVGHYFFDKHLTSEVNANDENYTVYHYKVTPIAMGLTYFIVHGHSSPYLTADIGYNLFANPIEESKNDSDDPLNLGIGGGIFYNMQKHWKMDLRYTYKYNKALENVNHIVLGIIYSF